MFFSGSNLNFACTSFKSPLCGSSTPTVKRCDALFTPMKTPIGSFCSVFATLEQFKYRYHNKLSGTAMLYDAHMKDCARIHATALWPSTFHLYRSINIEFHTWNTGYLTQKHHIIEKQSFTFSPIQVLSVHQMALPVVWKFQWHSHQSVGIFWEKGKCLHGAHQRHFPSLSVQHFPLSTTQMMSVCARHRGHSADWMGRNHVVLCFQCSLFSRPCSASQSLSV